jgi:hypothetical protein
MNRNQAKSFRLFYFLIPFLTIVLLSWQPREKVKMVAHKVANMLTVKVPENFQKLNDDQIADKIIATRKPLLMFSSPSGSADFSVSVGNSSKNPWQDSDLKLMVDFQKSNIRQLFTTVDFIQDKQVKVHGQTYGLLEFISEIKEKGKPTIRKYNHIRYTIRKKNVLVFSFICPEQERMLYEGTAEEIMQTIKF